jgi:hypothetical protein
LLFRSFRCQRAGIVLVLGECRQMSQVADDASPLTSA